MPSLTVTRRHRTQPKFGRLALLLTLAPGALAQQGLPRPQLAARLDHALAAERRAAVLEVGKLGEQARPFLAKLVDRMTDADLDVAIAVLDACSQLGDMLVKATTTAAAEREGQALLVTAAVLGQAGHTAPAGRQSSLNALVDTELGNPDPRRRILAAAAFGALTDAGVGLGAKLLRVLNEQGSLAAPAAKRTLTSHGERLHPVLRATLQQQPQLASRTLVGLLADRTKEHLELLATLARSAGGTARSDALWRLGRVGPRAHVHLDVLEATLTAPASNLRGAALRAFAQVSRDEDRIGEILGAALADPDQNVRVIALDELRSQRFLLPSTIARSAALLGDPTCREQTAELLGWCGQVRAETLRDALTATDPATRLAAVLVLARRGLATAQTLEPVASWLREEQTRAPALRIVQALSGEPSTLLPPVVDLLRGPDRALAMDALAAFGTKAADTTSRLIAALKDDSPAVRRSAAHALFRVAPGRREVVEALLRGSKDPESGGWCLWSLRAMGSEARVAADGLRRLLAESKPPIRLDVLRTLAAVGDVDPTVDVLVKILARPGSDAERAEAIRLLPGLFARDQRQQQERAIPSKTKKLGAPWPEVVKALLDVVRTGSPALRAESHATLGVLALDDAAQRCLRGGLREDGEVLAGVLRGLGHAALPLAQNEIERVGDLLVRGPEDVRELAASTLARSGPDGHPRLFAAMLDPDPAVRRAAVCALARLPHGTATRDEVFRTLSTADRDMRRALAWHFGPFAEDASVVERLLDCWRTAGDDLPQRRTLAEIAARLLASNTCHAKDRLLAKLRADADPIVQVHAATVTAR